MLCCAVQAFWLPPGEWFALHTGELARGPKSFTAPIHLADTPVFARGGSLVARRPLGSGAALLGGAGRELDTNTRPSSYGHLPHGHLPHVGFCS